MRACPGLLTCIPAALLCLRNPFRSAECRLPDADTCCGCRHQSGATRYSLSVTMLLMMLAGFERATYWWHCVLRYYDADVLSTSHFWFLRSAPVVFGFSLPVVIGFVNVICDLFRIYSCIVEREVTIVKGRQTCQ